MLSAKEASMDRTVISTDAAPAAVGPYSQAIRLGDLVFTAGQVAIDPATGRIDAVTVEDQTEQVLRNLRAVLLAAGTGLDRVVKCTVFMTDLGKFGAMNAVYGRFFASDPPARSAVQVGALPLGALVEIEAVATI
jgi:2-iminobutanoate/2-iminopropanoate deaminase